MSKSLPAENLVLASSLQQQGKSTRPTANVCISITDSRVRLDEFAASTVIQRTPSQLCCTFRSHLFLYPPQPNYFFFYAATMNYLYPMCHLIMEQPEQIFYLFFFNIQSSFALLLSPARVIGQVLLNKTCRLNLQSVRYSDMSLASAVPLCSKNVRRRRPPIQVCHTKQFIQTKQLISCCLNTWLNCNWAQMKKRGGEKNLPQLDNVSLQDRLIFVLVQVRIHPHSHTHKSCTLPPACLRVHNVSIRDCVESINPQKQHTTLTFKYKPVHVCSRHWRYYKATLMSRSLFAWQIVWVTVLEAGKQLSVLIQIQWPDCFSKQTTAVPRQMKWQVQNRTWQPPITTSHKAVISKENANKCS